jgi:hypothetical protein
MHGKEGYVHSNKKSVKKSLHRAAVVSELSQHRPVHSHPSENPKHCAHRENVVKMTHHEISIMEVHV